MLAEDAVPSAEDAGDCATALARYHCQREREGPDDLRDQVVFGQRGIFGEVVHRPFGARAGEGRVFGEGNTDARDLRRHEAVPRLVDEPVDLAAGARAEQPFDEAATAFRIEADERASNYNRVRGVQLSFALRGAIRIGCVGCIVFEATSRVVAENGVGGDVHDPCSGRGELSRNESVHRPRQFGIPHRVGREQGRAVDDEICALHDVGGVVAGSIERQPAVALGAARADHVVIGSRARRRDFSSQHPGCTDDDDSRHRVILPSRRMAHTETPSFAVVVPAYNEAAGIGACVRAIHESLERLPNRSALVVVDDGSADGTGDTLDELADRHARLVVVRHPRNRGYGAALRSGAETAADLQYDYVLFMDSDLTNDPASIPAFTAQMAKGVDVIKASRYVGGGGVDGVPLWRSSLSILGNLVARLLFGLPVRDTTNGFRAVRTSLLMSIDLEENGFAVIMEELYRLRPLARTYAEIPIVLTARTDDLRGSSFSFGPRAMAAYLRYPMLAARDRIGGRA